MQPPQRLFAFLAFLQVNEVAACSSATAMADNAAITASQFATTVFLV